MSLRCNTSPQLKCLISAMLLALALTLFQQNSISVMFKAECFSTSRNTNNCSKGNLYCFRRWKEWELLKFMNQNRKKNLISSRIRKKDIISDRRKGCRIRDCLYCLYKHYHSYDQFSSLNLLPNYTHFDRNFLFKDLYSS